MPSTGSGPWKKVPAIQLSLFYVGMGIAEYVMSVYQGRRKCSGHRQALRRLGKQLSEAGQHLLHFLLIIRDICVNAHIHIYTWARWQREGRWAKAISFFNP